MRSPAPRALLTTAAIAVSLAAADTYVVVLALTDMMDGVGVSLDALQKATPIVSGFLLGYVAVLPLIGRLADLLDRQRVLLACLALFVIGSGLTALATDLPVLVTGRVIQGLGGGGLVPATLAIVGALWPPERRGLPLGVVGAVQELGSVLGPLLGALILAVADWRAIFWLNAAAGIILAVAVAAVGGAPLMRPRPVPTALAVLALAVTALALAAPEALVTSVSLGVPFINFDGTTARLATPIGVLALALCALAAAVLLRQLWPVLRRADLLGALLLGGALGCVVLTFASANPEKEVVGSLGLGLLPVAAVLAAAYLVHHRRAANPLVPPGLVRGRTRWALIVSALVGVALVSVVVDVPLLARLVQSENQTEAALVLVRFLVAVPVGALLGGWSLRYLGDGLVAAVGLALASAGLFIMTGCGFRGRLGARPGEQCRAGGRAPGGARDCLRADRCRPDGRHGRGTRAAHGDRAARLLRGSGRDRRYQRPGCAGGRCPGPGALGVQGGCDRRGRGRAPRAATRVCSQTQSRVENTPYGSSPLRSVLYFRRGVTRPLSCGCPGLSPGQRVGAGGPPDGRSGCGDRWRPGHPDRPR